MRVVSWVAQAAGEALEERATGAWAIGEALARRGRAERREAAGTKAVAAAVAAAADSMQARQVAGMAVV